MSHHYCFQLSSVDSMKFSELMFFQLIPCGLPSRYQRALVQREKHIEQWQKLMKEAALSREQRKQFQAVVESRFQVSWQICIEGPVTLTHCKRSISELKWLNGTEQLVAEKRRNSEDCKSNSFNSQVVIG